MQYPPRYFYLILCAIVMMGICAMVPAHAAITPDEQLLLSQVSTAEMMNTIERLCSDEFNGRRAGSPEHLKAVDYLVSRLAGVGLSPLQTSGADGYRQPLTMRYSLVRSVDDIKATIAYSRPGQSGLVKRTRTLGYSGYNGRGGLDIRSQVVFVGYGVQDPTAGIDDYRSLDVKGKIVMWTSGRPSGQRSAKGLSGAQKMLTAYQQGAVACLAYMPPGTAEQFGTNIGLAGTIADFPCISVDKSLAAEMLGCDPAKARVGSVGADVQLTVPPVCDPERKTYNVIGMIPGSDPEVADRIVLVGAHYDHLGDNGSGKIYRGADDNASGVSVMLEVARVLHRTGLRPRRTMVFAFWTGEECGLVGSNYFIAHPLFPLDRIVSAIHADMVGAGDHTSFRTTGAKAYPDHYRPIAESARDLGLHLDPDSIRGASDHLAFARKKVPSTMISAAGEHPNYHSVGDVPAAIDRSVLVSAARLAALSAWRAANN